MGNGRLHLFGSTPAQVKVYVNAIPDIGKGSIHKMGFSMLHGQRFTKIRSYLHAEMAASNFGMPRLMTILFEIGKNMLGRCFLLTGIMFKKTFLRAEAGMEV